MNDTPQPQVPEQQPKRRVRKKVDPHSGDRLALLLTEYHRAKTLAESAGAEAEEYKSLIIAALEISADEETDVFDIAADPMGGYPAFTYRYTPEGWGVDTKRMASEEPETYVKFAKRRQGYWTFEAKKQGKRPGR